MKTLFHMEQQTLGLLDNPRLPGKEWDNEVDFPMMHSQYGIPKKRGNVNTHLPIREIACSC